jgi:hypothetical protein
MKKTINFMTHVIGVIVMVVQGATPEKDSNQSEARMLEKNLNGIVYVSQDEVDDGEEVGFFIMGLNGCDNDSDSGDSDSGGADTGNSGDSSGMTSDGSDADSGGWDSPDSGSYEG